MVQTLQRYYRISNLETDCIQQECIPVGCVPSTAVAISPATHTPYHAPLHTHHLPCTPPAMHTPCHACLPATHVSQPHMPPCHACLPTTHAPLPCMSPCHKCLTAIQAPHHAHPPLVDRILDTRLWKHYLSATSFADGNNRRNIELSEEDQFQDYLTDW